MKDQKCNLQFAQGYQVCKDYIWEERKKKGNEMRDFKNEDKKNIKSIYKSIKGLLWIEHSLTRLSSL